MSGSVLVYDGDCGICTRLADVVVRRVRPAADRYRVAPYQELDLASLGLTPEQCGEALQYVGPQGTVSSAQDAVARLLLAGRPWARPAGAALLLPGVNALAGVVYRWVAANRSRLPGGTPACSLPAPSRPGA